jgi:hypothetical protein
LPKTEELQKSVTQSGDTASGTLTVASPMKKSSKPTRIRVDLTTSFKAKRDATEKMTIVDSTQDMVVMMHLRSGLAAVSTCSALANMVV